MYILLDCDGNLSAYALFSNGRNPNNKLAYDIPLLKKCVIVADRFYNDFLLLNVWDSSGVCSASQRKPLVYIHTRNEHTDKRHEHVIKDERIRLTDLHSSKRYTGKFRRVPLWD